MIVSFLDFVQCFGTGSLTANACIYLCKFVIKTPNEDMGNAVFNLPVISKTCLCLFDIKIITQPVLVFVQKVNGICNNIY